MLSERRIKEEKQMETRIEKINKLREKADNIIFTEEWVEMITKQYNKYKIVIENGRTGKTHTIQPGDTEETIREWIKESYKKEE
jgi:hypothetical protein